MPPPFRGLFHTGHRVHLRSRPHLLCASPRLGLPRTSRTVRKADVARAQDDHSRNLLKFLGIFNLFRCLNNEGEVLD